MSFGVSVVAVWRYSQWFQAHPVNQIVYDIIIVISKALEEILIKSDPIKMPTIGELFTYTKYLSHTVTHLSLIHI